MGKGEETRRQIIEEAAGLFNRFGTDGTAISNVMDATGLKKGGIYRHFESKDQLAQEAFDLAKRRMARRYSEAVARESTAPARLRAVVDVAAGVPADAPVPGGCPLLSAAVESDYGNPVLKTRVRRAMDELHGLVEGIVRRGLDASEISPGTDPGRVATLFVASLEGGMMMTQLFEDPRYLNRIRSHLLEFVDRELTP